LCSCCRFTGCDEYGNPAVDRGTEKTEEEASLKDVMPLAERFEAVRRGEEIIYYKALDKSGDCIGVAFKASGKGYSSVIETMVGMKNDGEITAIKVISQNETPGLGTEVAGPLFTGRFSGKTPDNLKDIQAITGASISSQAVIDSVEKKAKEIRELLKNG